MFTSKPYKALIRKTIKFSIRYQKPRNLVGFSQALAGITVNAVRFVVLEGIVVDILRPYLLNASLDSFFSAAPHANTVPKATYSFSLVACTSVEPIDKPNMHAQTL